MRQYLKDIRIENKMLQRDVAAALGISQHYYSCIENGIKKKNMDLETLIKISDFYGVSLEWLAAKELQVVKRRERKE